jgi:CHAT domain-containing protein
LALDEFRLAKWYDRRQVELLVLSACETAIGDNTAEMGFAGLAVRSGVKSALASLWKVNDIGTLGLMTEFYRHLRSQPIKAEALRKAQLAMIHKQIVVKDGQLRGTERRDRPYSIGTSSKFRFLSPEVLGRIYNNWQSLVIGDICRETARRRLRRPE